MDWRERKRGKLECLNCFLTGNECKEILIKVGDGDLLRKTQYVITLDSDTLLPKETAKKLVATMAHPLNRPLFSSHGKLERGYTIIQPRISTRLFEINPTLFSTLFSERAAIDPYTQVVSNVYQDLYREGSYYGKGIYDVHAFHRILNERFPEEHLLSHDLIEGNFARVGLASDIGLYDSFPQTLSNLFFKTTSLDERGLADCRLVIRKIQKFSECDASLENF